jgi:hypothetical protein
LRSGGRGFAFSVALWCCVSCISTFLIIVLVLIFIVLVFIGDFQI